MIMGVPVEIRQVARPRNTVVVDTGSVSCHLNMNKSDKFV